MDQEIFKYDVFLSHSSNDKPLIRELAERLRADGLRVWFDEWVIRPGDVIPHQIELGLESSRVLVLCMSANAFGSDWARLEAGMFRFRDPLNKGRRFVPLRIDDAPVPGSLAQIMYVDWRENDRSDSYAKLLDACRPPKRPSSVPVSASTRLTTGQKQTINLSSPGSVFSFAEDGKSALFASGARILEASWTKANGTSVCLNTRAGPITSMFWDSKTGLILEAAHDKAIRVWHQHDATCHGVLEGHIATVTCFADLGSGFIVSGSDDETLRYWNLSELTNMKVLRGHSGSVLAVATLDGQVVSSGEDNTVRLWDVVGGRCIRVLEGHTASVRAISCSAPTRRVLTGSDDASVRLWDMTTGMCLRIFEGHTDRIFSLAWAPGQRFFATAAGDLTVRVWDSETGSCLAVLDGHQTDVIAVDWSPDGVEVLSADANSLRRWNVLDAISTAGRTQPSRSLDSVSEDQVLYTNAKVLLVGESGAGKTGLSKRLALNRWELSSSTVGAWATQWKVLIGRSDAVEREIWLWDFGGQADQRLIHQLYMDETSLVVLIFDGQKSDVFDSMVQWDNDLRRSAQNDYAKLLVAGRVDASPVRVAARDLEAFCKDHGYQRYIETSALTGYGCDELREAIVQGIHWDRIPWRSSPRLFKLLKEEVVQLKDDGRILMRFNDLRDMLLLKLHGVADRFTDEQLKAVLNLLTGPGVIAELKFGGWILFQPELINVYAQAVLRHMLEDRSEMGCVLESDVLEGKLDFQTPVAIQPDEERFILHAMHQILLERGLCSREFTDNGSVLVFPSYFKRHRPELVGHPAILVSYTFEGFVSEIYSTLVVRLHHTRPFEHDQLWQDAADFRTALGQQIGFKLTRKKDASGRIDVYCDPAIPLGEKIVFIRYVHEHLRLRATNVERRRHYVCGACGNALLDLEAVTRRAAKGLNDIGCPSCDARVNLVDEIEEMYASREMMRTVQGLEEKVEIELDNESKERALVGEVISAVALAGQICREKFVSDYGIDAEIEFKDDNHKATGELLFLQLKSGDSYLRHRKSDGKEIFAIKDARHAAYWMAQKAPVMLVIRNSKGEIRWMEIRTYLLDRLKQAKKDKRQRGYANEQEAISHIEFEGLPFDTTSILKWRARLLGLQDGRRAPKSATSR